MSRFGPPVDPFSLNNTRRFASDSSDEHLLAYATSKTNIAMGEVLHESQSSKVAKSRCERGDFGSFAFLKPSTALGQESIPTCNHHTTNAGQSYRTTWTWGMLIHVQFMGIDVGVSVSLNARYFGTSAKGNPSPPQTKDRHVYSTT
jgi:hypothetical protein